MLVLTRGLKQQIVIGDRRVVVTVLAFNGGRVRLGIEAPSDIVIRRMEIADPGRRHPLEQALTATATERIGCVESSERTLRPRNGKSVTVLK